MLRQNLPKYRSRYKKNSKNSLGQNKKFKENLEKEKNKSTSISKTEKEPTVSRETIIGINEEFEKFENFINVLDIRVNEKILIKSQAQILKKDLIKKIKNNN